MKQLFIAEIKTVSPFGFKSQHSFDYLLDVAIANGDWIAIHTDPRWGGDLSLIRKARKKTDKPILAKGIHVSNLELRQAIHNGADWALIVGRSPSQDIACKCIFEPTSLRQLDGYSSTGAIMWNSRDLQTGGLKKETWTDMRKKYPFFAIQASNIKTKADVKSDANAFIVGTCLVDFVKTL